jgi:hypothetical protein
MIEKGQSRDRDVRERILAIHEDDVKLLLTKLGIIEEVSNKQIMCPICSEVITVDNVGLIYKKNGKIVITCNTSHCQNAAQSGAIK